MRGLVLWLAAAVLALAAGIAGAAGDIDDVRRGEYLVRAGGCEGCHTERGGRPFAGGRGIVTPFGTVYSSNLTPDDRTGLGRWSADDFRRAMQEGRSRDGRLLYPAFPYANYARLTRTDVDAIYAYLRSLSPVSNANRPHTLRFPYDTQVSLAAWRARYFEPAAFTPDPARSSAWNRGAYLVNALGHCDQCHARRNAFGAIEPGSSLAGGRIPAQPWYAPSLRDPAEGSVADWSATDIVTFFRAGISSRGSALGPMAEVVARSTQYLSDEDLAAMAEYLKSLPTERGSSPPGSPLPPGPAFGRARRDYQRHCADCHGREGEGARGIYPALAGNRAVTMNDPTNVVRVILTGGFAPSTAGNPRPFGMPPFAQALRDEEVAGLASYIRAAWGNRASTVSAHEVNKLRGAMPE